MSAANGGGVWTQCVGQVAHFNLTPESLFYVDGLICYHSCFFFKGVRESALFTPFLGVSERSERECGLSV